MQILEEEKKEKERLGGNLNIYLKAAPGRPPLAVGLNPEPLSLSRAPEGERTGTGRTAASAQAH